MKAQEILCIKCGGAPEIVTEDGPFVVACMTCGRETIPWAYQREAWRQWRADNQPLQRSGKASPLNLNVIK